MSINLTKLSQKPSIKYLMLQGSVLLTSIAAGLVTYLGFLFIPETTAWGLFSYLLTAWVLIFPFGILYAFLGFIISVIIRRDKWLYSLPVAFITFSICAFFCSIYQAMYVSIDIQGDAMGSPFFGLNFVFVSLPAFFVFFFTIVLPVYLILLIFDFILKPSSDSPPLSGRDRLRVYIQLFGAGLFILTCLVYIASIFFILWYT